MGHICPISVIKPLPILPLWLLHHLLINKTNKIILPFTHAELYPHITHRIGILSAHLMQSSLISVNVRHVTIDFYITILLFEMLYFIESPSKYITFNCTTNKLCRTINYKWNQTAKNLHATNSFFQYKLTKSGLEFCRELRKSIWILLGGVCQNLWTILNSVCVKLLTVYQSLTGFSQINLAWVFVRVDSRNRIEILALQNVEERLGNTKHCFQLKNKDYGPYSQTMSKANQ